VVTFVVVTLTVPVVAPLFTTKVVGLSPTMEGVLVDDDKDVPDGPAGPVSVIVSDVVLPPVIDVAPSPMDVRVGGLMVREVDADWDAWLAVTFTTLEASTATVETVNVVEEFPAGTTTFVADRVANFRLELARFTVTPPVDARPLRFTMPVNVELPP
jgi:hypothetical protein